MGTAGRENDSIHRNFRGNRKHSWCLGGWDTWPDGSPYLPMICFQGYHLLIRKENSSRSFRVRFRFLLCYQTLSTSRLRNITRITFHAKWQSHSDASFPCHLGPTNPCPSSVHMEPFSTSVFKIRCWIVATTTKICTERSFTLTHVKASERTLPPSYTLPPTDIAAAVRYRWLASALSIFGASPFGRWVVTHSLADFNFHDHRPAVKMNQHPFWCLMSKHFGTSFTR